MSHSEYPGFVDTINREALIELVGHELVEKVEELANKLIFGTHTMEETLLGEIFEYTEDEPGEFATAEGLIFLAKYFEIKFLFQRATGMEIYLGKFSDEIGGGASSGVFWAIEHCDVWQKTQEHIDFEKAHGKAIGRVFFVQWG